MFRIRKSGGCCALYELYDIHWLMTDNILRDLLKKVKKKGYGHYPLIILFTDNTFNTRRNGNNHLGISDTSYGELLMEFLISRGYRVDKFFMGWNPKSNHDVNIFHWWVHRGNAVESTIREYLFKDRKQHEEKQEKPANSVRKSRRTSRTRVRGTRVVPE